MLVFDVNETLIDIETLSPLFEQTVGEAQAVREWFGQLVTYSMTAALSGNYVDFFTLGQGVLRMLGEIHGTPISDGDLDRIKQAMLTMPAHPDVADGLTMLRDSGFRLVTLTNSPPNPDGHSPLENAGLGGYFERQFSVDATGLARRGHRFDAGRIHQNGRNPAERTAGDKSRGQQACECRRHH